MLKQFLLLLIGASLVTNIFAGRRPQLSTEEVATQDKQFLELKKNLLKLGVQNRTRNNVKSLDVTAERLAALVSNINKLHQKSFTATKDLLDVNSDCIEFLSTMGSPVGAVSIQVKNADKAKALSAIETLDSVTAGSNGLIIQSLGEVEKLSDKIIEILKMSRIFLTQITEGISKSKNPNDPEIKLVEDDIKETLNSIENRVKEDWKFTMDFIGRRQVEFDNLSLKSSSLSDDTTGLKNGFECSLAGEPDNGQYLSESHVKTFQKQLKDNKAKLDRLGEDCTQVDNNPENLKKIQDSVKRAIKELTFYYQTQSTRSKEVFQKLKEVCSK